MPNSATLGEIATAYTFVLGRNADERGLNYFAGLAASQGLSIHEIVKLLISSEEFRIKSGASHDPLEVELDGYSIFVRSSDRDIGSAIVRGVSYEPHISALLRRKLISGDTFLDVGANVGFFTMLAAHLVGKKGRVIAVEPLDKNLQLIYLGLIRNGYTNVEINPFGASDKAGLVSIITDANTSNALVQAAASDRKSAMHAPVRTLDSMCSDINRLDFIKIDIEGHELFAWHGAKNILAKFRPNIVTEFHPLAMRENSGVGYEDYLSLLFDYSRCIQVIVSPNELVDCTTPHQIVAQWKIADQRHGGQGTTHLDLFLRSHS